VVTLDRLVNVLGGYGVRLRFCPIPRSTELRSVVMHEATGDRTVVGDVLLGIGARSVKEAVRWAASARAVVVLIRDSDDDSAFGGADEGVAVMVVDPAVSWSELAGVIYGLVLEGRETESGRGPTDLFALADSLADAIGGAVIIEDRLSRVLAYSRLHQHADPARVATILERQAPEQLRAFFELLPGEPSATARKWVTGLKAALPERVTMLAGISGAAGVADLVAARQEADECLALHEVWPRGATPPAYDESWDDILLQRLRTAAQSGRSPDRGPVAELRRHDQAHATEYVITLRAWLEAQGDPTAAGERLGVHENTIRYRLRKMAEVANLQLDDAKKRLAMMIELAASDTD
jgi:hypothetical protein